MNVLRGTKNPHVFETLLSPQLGPAYRFAHQLTKNEADAEDLLQDGCHQAFAKFHLFRRGTNFKAWLFRIIRNLHIDHLRRRRRAPEIEDLRQHLPTQVDEEALEALYRASEDQRGRGTIENENVFYDLFGDEVNRFLSELPVEFRSALLLCDLEGFSYQEIGEILDCPIGTVRSRISRARGFLKENLYEYARSLGYLREPKQ